MTDRELLELAAKAAGHEVRVVLANGDIDIGLQHAAWNPLTDDGDALRLAVKLRIELCFGAGGGSDSVWPADEWDLIMEMGQDEPAAVRRCIVRAAAAIGGSQT